MKQYRIVFWIDDPETKEVYGEKKQFIVTGISEKMMDEFRQAATTEVGPEKGDELVRLTVKTWHTELAQSAGHLLARNLGQLMTEDALPSPEVPLDHLKSA